MPSLLCLLLLHLAFGQSAKVKYADARSHPVGSKLGADISIVASPSQISYSGQWVTVSIENATFGADSDWVGVSHARTRTLNKKRAHKARDKQDNIHQIHGDTAHT